jgi:hypothetical protein
VADKALNTKSSSAPVSRLQSYSLRIAVLAQEKPLVQQR